MSIVYRHTHTNDLYRLYKCSPPKMTGSYFEIESYAPLNALPVFSPKTRIKLSENGYYSLKNLTPAFKE